MLDFVRDTMQNIYILRNIRNISLIFIIALRFYSYIINKLSSVEFLQYWGGKKDSK